jgi:hypothetical protein
MTPSKFLQLLLIVTSFAPLSGCKEEADSQSSSSSLPSTIACSDGVTSGCLESIIKTNLFFEQLTGDGHTVAQAFASAGDFNGDGYDDIAVGDLLYGTQTPNTTPGRLIIYSGKDHSILFSKENYINRLGRALAYIGDVNGDGKADIAVSSAPGINEQHVQVYSISTSTPILDIIGPVTSKCFGYSVSSAGDWNNDGVPDIIIGDPCFNVTETNPGLTDNTGKAYVYSGQNGTLLQSFLGASPHSDFGFTAALVHDLNNDGREEIAIGGRWAGINVYSGASQHILWSSSTTNAFDIAPAGDVNNDGIQDILVGTISGLTMVFSGLDGTVLHSIYEGYYYEKSVAALGDVNNDGYDDFATWYGHPNKKLIIFSGKTGAIVAEYKAETDDQNSFHQVKGGGDINGDGKPDLVMYSQGFIDSVNGIGVGKIYVFEFPGL